MDSPPLSHAETPFFRVRWLIRLHREVRLHAHHGAVLYALLANANRAAGDPPAFPDGLLPDAPEQARVLVRAGESFAFGGTLLDHSAEAAGRRLTELTRELHRLGEKTLRQGAILGGNFEIVAVEDLVTSRPLEPGVPPNPIPLSRIDGEIERLLNFDEITLRFTSPLRMERPGAARRPGRSFLDHDWFDPAVFVGRLLQRLPAAGIARRDGRDGRDGARQSQGRQVEMAGNRLVWLDLEYGRRDDRKTLGGAVGSVRLRTSDPEIKAALVWGQYTRVGKNTSFGFGAYRIVELGDDPYICSRAAGLLELALRSAALDQRAAAAGLESGELRAAARRLLEGAYTPDAPTSFLLRPAGAEPRELCVPSIRDRALQRLVLDEIGPGLDRFFEDSSLAWRRGLGRESAPRHVVAAWRQGFRYAVRADFDRFFDSVALVEIEDRLRSYLADDRMAEAVLAWVRAGRPGAAQGLPTGAPLSPLLGNLMLDQFDERIAAAGGRLVRYADDFLILTRTREEAERLWKVAEAEAETLRLALNDDPSPILDLREPFTFVGYRFERKEGWEKAGKSPPLALEELGWHDAARPVEPAWRALPGEMEGGRDVPWTTVLGPEAVQLEVGEGGLVARRAGEARPASIPCEPGGALVLLGAMDLPADVLALILKRQMSLLFADAAGRVQGSLGDEPPEDPEVLLAQGRAAADPQRLLAIARALAAAKLRNHAALAEAVPGRDKSTDLAQELRTAAGRAEAACSVEELRGVEGAAAVRWYDHLPHRLGRGFSFERRVSPDADDPVNVLLNIAQTALYRHALLAARAAGLSPVLGVFHTSSRRYAALASDLQEPFRHLMERVVIAATHRLQPRQFHRTPDGPFALSLAPDGARQFQALIYHALAAGVVGSGQTEPATYREQILRTARSLRRHLLEPKTPFQPFTHP